MTLALVSGHMYCQSVHFPFNCAGFRCVFTVLFGHLGLQLLLFEYALCSSIFSTVWFFLSFSYNSEQYPESWLAKRSVLIACDAPFSRIDDNFSLQRRSIKNSQVFCLLYINSQCDLTFIWKLNIQFCLCCYLDIKYTSKLFAAASVVVQI